MLSEIMSVGGTALIIWGIIVFFLFLENKNEKKKKD